MSKKGTAASVGSSIAIGAATGGPVGAVIGGLQSVLGRLFGKRKQADQDNQVTEGIMQSLKQIEAELNAGLSDPQQLQTRLSELDKIEAEGLGQVKRASSKTNWVFTTGIPTFRKKLQERLQQTRAEKVPGSESVKVAATFFSKPSNWVWVGLGALGVAALVAVPIALMRR